RTSREYEFYSEGPKGKILKLVQFQLNSYNGFSFYNLVLGDYNRETGYLDALSVTNNGDAEKVLSTVAAIVIDFTNYFEDAIIYTEGSTSARTRRYQIGINKFLDEIEKIFNVYGRIDETWAPFKKNINYNGFFVTRKIKDFIILQEPEAIYMTTPEKVDINDPNRIMIDRRIVELPDFSNDPFTLRKNAMAIASIEKYGFPEELLKKPR
ncbi:MAG TPA: hypothetical protein VGM41_09150, partial [Chitinophagaceae bacterium]